MGEWDSGASLLRSGSLIPPRTFLNSISMSSSSHLSRVTTLTRVQRMISIRWILPLFVLTPVVSGILLTSWLAFRSGHKAVEDSVDKITTEVASNIAKQVTSYLSKPMLISATLSTEINNGTLDISDVRVLGQNLWSLTQSDLLVNNLYYGNQRGEFVYSSYQDGLARLDFVDTETGFQRIAYDATDGGVIGQELSVSAYDPRVRTWYEEALASREAIWSQVYIAKSRAELTLTRATPIINSAGEVEGVLGIDVYLLELSQFLQDLTVSPNGRAFILETSGDLIAISTDEQPFVGQGQSQLRLPATDSADPLVRATANYLLENVGDLSKMGSQYSFDFDLDGQRQLARIHHVRDMGFEWIIGVTIPQKDYMTKIHANARHTLIIGIGVTIAASLLALGAALYIIRPINKLNQVADDIKHNRFDPHTLDGVSQRFDEFGKLAKVFDDMATVVAGREQGLAEQVKVLKREIDQARVSTKDPQVLEALVQRSQAIRQTYIKR